MNIIIQGILVFLALFMTWGSFIIGDYMYLIWGPFAIFISGFFLIYIPSKTPLMKILISIPMALGFFMLYEFKRKRTKKHYTKGEM